MRCESFNDVLVRDVLVESSGQLRSGVFNNDGVIGDSLLRRHYGVYIDARTDPVRGTAKTGSSGPVIFGGYLRSHFGHFLLETLNAAWALREHPHLPIVWIPLSDETQWLGWQLEILELLGISRHRHIINCGATRYEHMYVAQPGYEIQRTFHAVQEKALAQVAPASVVTGKRLWLSRGGLASPAGALVNEGELEAQLEANGWTIFVPDGQTIARQLEEISSAQIVSGIAGSAFHSVLLLRHVSSIMMPVFSRIPKNENLETIRRRKGFEQVRVDVPPAALEVVAKGKWHGANTVRLLEPSLVLEPLLRAQELIG